MAYYTQETLAIQTIERLKNAGADSICLWLHTSQLEPENKNLNKMNMIVHLLNPLEKTTVYKLFFLQRNFAFQGVFVSYRRCGRCSCNGNNPSD